MIIVFKCVDHSNYELFVNKILITIIESYIIFFFLSYFCSMLYKNQ